MASHAETMVGKIRAVMSANPGVEMIQFDGETVRYRDLEKRLRFWERELNRERGRRPVVSQIRLDKAY